MKKLVDVMVFYCKQQQPAKDSKILLFGILTFDLKDTLKKFDDFENIQKSR